MVIKMKKLLLLLSFLLLTGCGSSNPNLVGDAVVSLLFDDHEQEPQYTKEFTQALDAMANAPDSDAQQIHHYQNQTYHIAYTGYSAQYHGERQEFHLVKVWPQQQVGFLSSDADRPTGHLMSLNLAKDIAQDFVLRNYCPNAHPYKVKDQSIDFKKQGVDRFERFVFAFTCEEKAQPYETKEFYNAIEALGSSHNAPIGLQPQCYTYKSIFGYSYDYRLIHQSYNQAGYQLYFVKIWPRDHEGFDKLVPYDFKASPKDAAEAFVAKNDCKNDNALYPVHEYTIYLQEQGRIKSTQYVFAFQCHS